MVNPGMSLSGLSMQYGIGADPPVQSCDFGIQFPNVDMSELHLFIH